MTATSTNEEARRNYWTQQLEQGFQMVQQLLAFPVCECHQRLASIPEAAEAAGVEMLFSTSKIAGDLDRVYFIRESLLDDVIAIGADMSKRTPEP